MPVEKVDFGEAILVGVTTILQPAGVAQVAALLDQFRKNDPEGYEKVMLSFYPVVDVQLEAITKKTKTKVDDFFVNVIKGAMEASALNAELTLPNLDKD